MHWFRQIKHQIIHIPQEGLIAILGLNGTGKSTFFNAIGWAIYGKIKDVTNNMIKNQQAGKRDKCYVEIEFDFLGDHYLIHRDLVSSRCYAQVNGYTKAVGTSNLNAFTEETFKMDYRAFTVCYYAQQEDSDALSKLNPGPRVATLSKLLRIDAIDTAAENKRREGRELKTEIDEIRRKLEQTQRIKEELEQFRTQLQTVTNVKKQSDQEIEELEKRKRDLKQKLELLEKDFQLYLTLKNQKVNITSQIQLLTESSIKPNLTKMNALKTNKTRYEEIKDNKPRYQELKTQKESMESLRLQFQEKQTLERSILETDNQVKEYQEHIKKIQDTLQKTEQVESMLLDQKQQYITLEEELQALREEHSEQKANVLLFQQNVKALQQEKEHFHKLGDETPCPTCKRELGEYYGQTLSHIEEKEEPLRKELQHIEKELTILQQKGVQKRKESDTVKVKIEELQKQFNVRNQFVERLTNTQTECEKNEKKKAELTSRLAPLLSISFDIDAYNKIVQELKIVTPLFEEMLRIESALTEIPEVEKNLRDLKGQITTLKNQINESQTALDTLNFNEPEYHSLKRLEDDVQETLNQKIRSLSDLEKKIGTLDTAITHREATVQEHTLLVTKRTALEKRVVLLEKLDLVYKQYKIDILRKLSPILSEIMSEDMEYITQGKYEQVELDENYDIFIYRDGIKNPLSFYSGGEQKIAALCLRLAISNLLTDQSGVASFEMIAMDEVFGSLDNEHQDQMIDMLRNLKEKYPQVLVVTHAENIKDMFDYVLEASRDNHKHSVYKWHEEWDEEEVKEILASYIIEEVEEEEDEFAESHPE